MSSRSNRRPPPKRPAKPSTTVQRLLSEAEALAAADPDPDHGTEPVSPQEATEPVTQDRLRKALAQAQSAGKRAEVLQAKLEKKQEELEETAAKLDQDRVELAQQLTEWRQRQEAADEADKDLARRTEHVVSQEEEAKRGFARYRQEQLDALRDELAERRAAFDEKQRTLEADRDTWHSQQESTLHKRAAELDDLASALAREQLEHRRKDRQLGARQEHLDTEVTVLIAERLTELERELSLARQESESYRLRLGEMRDLAERRATELAENEIAVAEFGGRSAPEVSAELRRLAEENRELRLAAATRPDQDHEYGAELGARYHDLTVENSELLRQNSELRRHVAATSISSVERENASMISNALRQQNETLSQELQHMERRLELMQASVKDNPPFPACTLMDHTEDYHQQPAFGSEPVRLREFVLRLRGRMALDLNLHYTEADLRCFVAGLAASRLHLLEGISGIGKTRLPEAFCQIIGAGRETVPVAAEWRSPQDLLGYYNPFERKFYESEFTQSLYRAQLPLFRHKPFFVVLDEMNLSHPEQYFSDLLYAMERKESDQACSPLIPLMTSPVSPAPELLRDGRALELPGNVWFIGTANNDETTVRFADKTYDRAHVLVLPSKRPPPVTGEDPPPFAPVSCASLLAAFDAAEREHTAAASLVLEFFDHGLGDRLRSDFGLSWGIRLERQARRFVPATVAAGGTSGEAADHLLATKVLRKLTGRIEVAAGDLRELRNDISVLWDSAFAGTVPAKSLKVLEGQIRSLGQV
jgi:hypothetical protein